MPVSKKRKKKRYVKKTPLPAKNAAPNKKKISRQQILIYIITGVMIISLAASLFAFGGSSRQGAQNNPVQQPQTADGNNLLVEPQQSAPTSPDQTVEEDAMEEDAAPDTATESTTEN